MAEVAVLSTVLSDYPLTRLLKTGEVSDPGFRFDFKAVAPVHKAFAPMARHGAYDLCELAIVAALQAVAYGRPIIILPLVVASRFQRRCIISAADRGPLDPHALADKRIGVRAYTQTTGMWVRAHLEEDYGLPVGKMRWVTQDPSHVSEYSDPPLVQHVSAAESLPEMLLGGSLDAVIMGNDLPKGDAFIPVIPDYAVKDRAWWEKHGFMPINHLVAVSHEAANRAPDAVRKAYRLLRDAEALTRPPSGEPCSTMAGFESLRGPIEFTIGHCRRQGLLPNELTVEEVLRPASDLLCGD